MLVPLHLQRATDTDWQELMIQGDKGETGSQGDKGDQGVKGDTGQQGIQGDQGEQGVKGDPADIAMTIGLIIGATVFLLLAYIIVNVLAPRGIFKPAKADLSDPPQYMGYRELEEKNQNDVLLQKDIRLRFLIYFYIGMIT